MAGPRLTARLTVVSPHLDDAVLGCGELIAAHPGSVVLTLFAGIPRDTGVLPEWDAACGFGSARQAMIVRRREDREALERLDAEPCWLGCLDRQYRHSDAVPGLALKLARALRRRAEGPVVIPLGIFHTDHRIAHETALELHHRDSGREWMLYEEPNYRLVPGLVKERLRQLEAAGWHLEPLPYEGRFQYEKKAAIECYASQLRGLASAGRPGHADALAPERCWRLSRV